MKYPNYFMRMMSNGGRLLADDTRKETKRRCKVNGEDILKKFKYKLPFHWHVSYHHAIDNHNNLKHALTLIEDTCITDWW